MPHRMPHLRALATTTTFAFALALTACGSSDAADCSDTDGACDRSADSVTAKPHPFDFGVEGWQGDQKFVAKFREAAGATSSPRLCHVYTYWDIAHKPGGTHTLDELKAWFDSVEGKCDEVLVTFKGSGDEGDIPAIHPSETQHEFRDAFLAFLDLTAPTKKLEHWKGKLSFTPWNEPNNQGGGGNGLGVVIPAQDAARLYMVMRASCSEAKDDCKVAAGDFATNGTMDDAIEWNCANDNLDAPDWCAKKSPFNHRRADGSFAPPSYLDVYKHTIAVEAHAKHHLPVNFRPEYFAYHPWQDVNDYVDRSAACSDYDHCVTRRLLQSLGGSWGSVKIWDDEIGVGSQRTAKFDEPWRQPCGAAFLVRLTDMSPRITRLYYMWFGQSFGRLVDEDPTTHALTLNEAGSVLARHQTSYSHACPETGIPLK